MGGRKKEIPWNFYYYPYILRTGEVCNQRCYNPKGCKAHQNSPKQYTCIESGCNKKTFSGYSAYKKHSGKYRSRAFYQCQKLAKNSG
ncbi:hypothetical protein RclHR1_08070018 [Rhizophagus clarus]|uniref:Uncharacterized protein n=1 Tax=Rhizophagus clarus TaxID=94130 RepID=A0A2Z6RZN0_9GLOM|nr:hypothetical protein RclHR1_08070018 [Rhizophagus clarus]GES97150.1 hypothetical protein GLOIN_2v1791272 [Rhizophagus clarus]